MDKIFRLTKVAKILSNEKFCPKKILSDIVLSDKVDVLSIKDILAINSLLTKS